MILRSYQDTLPFGKYIGKTFNYVIKEDYKYIKWALNEGAIVITQYDPELKARVEAELEASAEAAAQDLEDMGYFDAFDFPDGT